MNFEQRYSLILAVVERHAQSAPADLPESARIAWIMQPVRDLLKDYETRIEGLNEVIEDYDAIVRELNGDD